MQGMETQFKYRAFISYSHSDERWATWLHRALETYRVPKHLVGRESPYGPVPERFAPVFRDRDELATATNLGETLTRALEQSAFQIVICSPKAAASKWVNEEILTFKRLGRERRIFPLIVGGEPGSAEQECFPQALRFRMGADGQLTDEPTESIAADARPGKDGKLDVKLKLLAGMLGVGLDELKQREAHRRQVRMMWLAGASIAGMAITSTLAGAAWLARNEAERQRVRAENEAETARQTTRFMVDLFKVSDPSEALGNKITAREILDKGALRINRELADQPAIQATLMDTMGTVYTSLGLYEPAERLVRQAYARRQTLFGSQNPETVASLNHLGEVLSLKSNFDEAEKKLRTALEIRRKLFGESNPAVAETLSLLAYVLGQKGEYDRGEPLIREALQIRRKVFGEVAAEVAASIEDLGRNFYDRGEYDQAVTYLRQALAMQEKLHKGAHPALAQSMDNLAWALMGQGKADEAEPLTRRALAMKRQLYGEDHPETAMGLNNLAYILEQRGSLDEAEKTYREALAINRRLLGAEHPTIALNLANIAYVEYAKGNHDGGIDLLRQSIDMSRKVLGPEHPEVAARGTGLAYWLLAEGRYDEAGALVDESLAIRRKALGPEHPQVAGTLTVKANLLLATRHYEEARATAVEAQRILLLSLPQDSWQVSAAMNIEGAALGKLGRFGEAEKLLVASLPGLKQSPIPDLAAAGRRRLVELYTAWGRPEQASKIAAGG
jgi:tetratricopeptide (TPR) repeat protein